MAIMIGSARLGSNGKTTGDAAGDQKQVSSTNDTKGEVSMQEMYTHSKGWYILRPKSEVHAGLIACKMISACNNTNIGYDQDGRYGIIEYGISTKTKTECDCSSLVRQCVKEATGKDPGDFSTANEATVLAATGLFEGKAAYVSQAKTPVYNGDILVTKVKGHTAVVVSGNPRADSSGTGSSGTLSSKLQAAQSKDAGLAGTYKVTASSLNLRYGPDSSKYAVITAMPKGTACRCYGYYTANGGTKWLYVEATVNGKKYTGFASKAYLAK